MPITLGNTSISGLGVGGLPSGVVNAATLASSAVTRAKMGYSGAVLQVLSATKTNVFTTTSTSYTTITGLSINVTPTSASSKIFIMYDINAGAVGAAAGVRIYRNSDPISIGDAVTTNRWTSNVYNGGDDSNSTPHWAMHHLDSPNTTSAITYSLQAGLIQGSGTFVLNDQTSQVRNTTFSGTSASSITVMEIAG